MLRSKKILKVKVMVLFVVSTATALWALDANYNRPNPLLDYVPQEIGLYDTFYDELGEMDCRNCHGNSMSDTHHDMSYDRLMTPEGVLDCYICHETTGSTPTGANVAHDCKSSGCHSLADVQSGNRRWHHNTEAAAAFNCVSCHDPNILSSEIGIFQPFSLVPPTHITPMPFSCENCHWDQEVSGVHPYGASGQYGKPILSNYDTHHMGFSGRVSSECYLCHAGSDPNSLDWNTQNREIIRFCEKCHTPVTLHAFNVSSPNADGIFPHVSATDAWEAAGFHVAGDPGEFSAADVDPATLRTFAAQEMCDGCHGDYIPQAPATPVNLPVISAGGIDPTAVQCYQSVTVNGSDFGPVHVSGSSYVQMSEGVNWFNMPIDSWTDSQIQFTIPCQTITTVGVHNIRVITVAGNSNTATINIVADPAMSSLTPATGDHGQWLTITGTGFGSSQTSMYDDVYGIHTQVELADTMHGTGGMIVLLEYQNWTSGSIEARFNNYYIDSGLSGDDRDFTQDPLLELTMLEGEQLFDGTFNVFVKSYVFMDNDLDDTLSPGDTVIKELSTQAAEGLQFERVSTPSLWSAMPASVSGGQILTLYGVSLGTSGSGLKVMYGTQAEYDASGGTPFGSGAIAWGWRNTRIMIDVPATIPAGTYRLWIDYDGTDPGTVKSNPIDLTVY